MKVLYTATVTAQGARNGRIESADGTFKMDLAKPKELGGTGKQGTNPEQLFAGAYAACFGGALEAAASQKKRTLQGATVTARVGMGPREQGGYGLAVELDIRLPGIPKQEAEMLVAEAHKICPYSNATRGNIDVVLKVLD